MRTIKVTGSGRLKLRPDTTRITLTLSGTEREYDAAVGASADETKALGSALENAGFSREDLKTQSFSINTEYESYEENGRWQQRFLGYRFLHVLRVDFPAENGLLGQVLSALADCPAKAELQISHTVRDPEAAKTQLLGKAVADARAKADVLAAAAGVGLKAIQSIDYAWGEIRFERRLTDSLDRPMAAKSAFDLDIEPDDIDVSDTVAVVWEIE